jgi:DNA-binding response OmpR family regulator
LIRLALAEALRGWGHAPVEAATIKDALNALYAERPRAVLLGINLPDGSGLEALSEIRRRQPQTLVIVMMTGDVRDVRIVSGRGACLCANAGNLYAAASLLGRH